MRERFEEKIIPVTESGCWLWTASCHERGYGLFYTGRRLRLGKMEFAHRVSYEIYKNHQPTKDEEVCHKCDNPYCVNPDHLFIGSHKENMMDMVKKNRVIVPSTTQKVSREMMIKAVCMRNEGKSLKEIASVLGISPSHASRISRGQRKLFSEELT